MSSHTEFWSHATEAHKAILCFAVCCVNPHIGFVRRCINKHAKRPEDRFFFHVDFFRGLVWHLSHEASAALQRAAVDGTLVEVISEAKTRRPKPITELEAGSEKWPGETTGQRALHGTQPNSTFFHRIHRFFSHLHIPSIPEKISGAAPSAERHGSHGSCNVNRAWYLPHDASCQVRDRMVSTSICCKLVHSLMTRKRSIFPRWWIRNMFLKFCWGGTELRGIFWIRLRKVVTLLDAEGGDVVFWMKLSSNVLLCLSVLWGRHWQWHSSLLLWQRTLRRYVACRCVEIYFGTTSFTWMWYSNAM